MDKHYYPSQCTALCNCPGWTPMKLALARNISNSRHELGTHYMPLAIGLGEQEDRLLDRISAPPLTSSMILGKWYSFSVPQLSHL